MPRRSRAIGAGSLRHPRVRSIPIPPFDRARAHDRARAGVYLARGPPRGTFSRCIARRCERGTQYETARRSRARAINASCVGSSSSRDSPTQGTTGHAAHPRAAGALTRARAAHVDASILERSSRRARTARGARRAASARARRVDASSGDARARDARPRDSSRGHPSGSVTTGRDSWETNRRGFGESERDSARHAARDVHADAGGGG